MKQKDIKTCFTAAMALLAIGMLWGLQSGSFSGSGRDGTLENPWLRFSLQSDESNILLNKLTGRTFSLSSEPFALVLEKQGRRSLFGSSDFTYVSVSKPSFTRLTGIYQGRGDMHGVRIQVEYILAKNAWYLRKYIYLDNASTSPLTIKDAQVEKLSLEDVAPPEEPNNPVFLEDQLFLGLEWPIAHVAQREGALVLEHYPDVTVPPGESWKSKVSALGVAERGQADSAFGRYLHEIRANRAAFTTLYFDWLCHDNSGPLESEILANFAALKKMKELYGLQFDIYNSDAGLVESMGTYFPQYRPIFDRRFPNGLSTVAAAAADLGMRLGLWIGPDGFGETPQEMEARKHQLISWVKESNVGLFKLDTVVSPLRHPDKYILEKKYQALADTLNEIRAVDPQFVAINHRVNNSPYMLTITDCILWQGEETYIDVHISNRDAWLHNRVCSVRRDLSTLFFDTPFRLFEDHGICFNSLLERWDDDLVTQAFGRASVISPEMYGAFFFLADHEWPRFARLLQLHKEMQDILRGDSRLLADGDMAHSNGHSAVLVVRNMNWDHATKTIPLDTRLGLTADHGTHLIIRQRHPHEFLLGGQSDGFRIGDNLELTCEPFEVKLIQIDSAIPKDPYLGGIAYEVIPRGDPSHFSLRLLGRAGKDYEIYAYNMEDRILRDENGAGLVPSENSGSAIRVSFAGNGQDKDFFQRIGAFEEIDAGSVDGVYLTELAKFRLDDDALEIREMRGLKRRPSRHPEVEACRAYMWDKVIRTHTYHRNAFDGDPDTRWSDGYPQRSPFTGSPRPYRSDTSLWRIDLGALVALSRLELHIVRRLEEAELDRIELSADLKSWIPVEGIELPGQDRIPFFEELRRRDGNVRIHDVASGDGRPVVLAVDLPANTSRYVRILGRNFSVSEIYGFDPQDRKLDRSRWRATNFYGSTLQPYRVLQWTGTPKDHWPGQEIAVAVEAGPDRLHPIDDVIVVLRVDGEIIVPQRRAPSYPYHNYEWNSWWLMRDRLEGMTYRVPIDSSWKGRMIEGLVLLFGEHTQGVSASAHIVTLEKPYATKVWSVTDHVPDG